MIVFQIKFSKIKYILFCRNMIADGGWPKDMKYITCDDYDGKNTPSRQGMNLKKYFYKVSF